MKLGMENALISERKRARTLVLPYNSMPWHIYIIECNDSKLYTGITNNLERRIKAHNCGNGGRFTKYRTPVKLLHSEECLTKSDALKREAQIKRMEKSEKLALIETL